MTPSQEQITTTLDYYRRALDGHVLIRETVATFLDVLGARIECLARAPKILELGSHAGVVSSWLLERFPGASLLVHDDDELMVAISRGQLAKTPVTYLEQLRTCNEPVDFVVSIARHHHLPHDYLSDLRRIMTPETVYVLADELCPEYCAGLAAARIRGADRLEVVGGYLLTSEAELAAHRATGVVPDHARQLEDARRRALWRWYRYVVDEAVERGYFDIAVGELRSTYDDLITGSDAEHKFSPLIVERQLELAGFRLLSKRLVGPADIPERQSMFVYEFGLA